MRGRLHAKSTFPPRVQVRDFIADSLYNQSYGYFAEKGGEVVGEIVEPIEFGRLSGEH